MQALSTLLDALYFTSSHLAKSRILQDYLANTPDPERGWVLGLLAGELDFKWFKRNTIKQLILQRCDETLFNLSYDYVGEMSETVAHLWPNAPTEGFVAPSLSEFIAFVQSHSKAEVEAYLVECLNNLPTSQRWTLIKLGTGGLRVGLSARRLKQILASYGNRDVNDIEQLWHGLAPPYTDLLAWLEQRGPKPDISDKTVFHPVMLAHPLLPDVIANLDFAQYVAEHKYDGIRVQLVIKAHGKALFSRTGDDISHSFPDVLALFDHVGVYDAELLAFDTDHRIASFNQLQQRLNKKKPSHKLQNTIPCGLQFYDLLAIGDTELVSLPLIERQARLAQLVTHMDSPLLNISTPFNIQDHAALVAEREKACSLHDGHVEGLMLKRKDAPYTPGRPKGVWYKFKRDPKLIDAVIMYAQRGHGKRSSYYSDFTFGLWAQRDGNTVLLPIGKAYSGFTDAELTELDKWVRQHTIGRFGPVKEVHKSLVVEVAFDSAHVSTRHKSGVALRFPRFHRIRWDKPAAEADTLECFERQFIQL